MEGDLMNYRGVQILIWVLMLLNASIMEVRIYEKHWTSAGISGIGFFLMFRLLWEYYHAN